MDMVESEDEAVGCGTWILNSLHYFVPDPLDDVGQEIADQAEGWPPLQAGLFDGSVEQLKQVKEQIDGIVRRSGW